MSPARGGCGEEPRRQEGSCRGGRTARRRVRRGGEDLDGGAEHVEDHVVASDLRPQTAIIGVMKTWLGSSRAARTHSSSSWGSSPEASRLGAMDPKLSRRNVVAWLAP